MSVSVGKIAALGDLERLLEVPRKRSNIEAPWEMTLRVVRLELAWAYARVGAGDRSAELLSAASLSFDERLPIFREVLGRYRARILEAGGGAEPPDTADSLSRDDRYQVNRLINASLVLAPREAPNAFAIFAADAATSRKPLINVRRISAAASPDELDAELRAIDVRRHAPLDPIFPVFLAVGRHGLAAVRRLMLTLEARWPDATDVMSANAFWCLNVITYVDAVAFAIAEAVDPLDTAAR